MLAVACASHFVINDDTKIVRTPKNMAASVVNLPGMTLQPLYTDSSYKILQYQRSVMPYFHK